MREDELRWFTSSFSGGNANCVEVAVRPDGDVTVRDTKDRSRTPHRYPASAWAAFLGGIRAGEFGVHPLDVRR